jgi:hypothetical protein
VDDADVLAALFGGELPHRSQVEAPVPSADHEGSEAPARMQVFIAALEHDCIDAGDFGSG